MRREWSSSFTFARCKIVCLSSLLYPLCCSLAEWFSKTLPTRLGERFGTVAKEMNHWSTA